MVFGIKIDNGTEQRVQKQTDMYTELIFDKDEKAMEWRGDSLSISGVGTEWIVGLGVILKTTRLAEGTCKTISVTLGYKNIY